MMDTDKILKRMGRRTFLILNGICIMVSLIALVGVGFYVNNNPEETEISTVDFIILGFILLPIPVANVAYFIFRWFVLLIGKVQRHKPTIQTDYIITEESTEEHKNTNVQPKVLTPKEQFLEYQNGDYPETSFEKRATKDVRVNDIFSFSWRNDINPNLVHLFCRWRDTGQYTHELVFVAQKLLNGEEVKVSIEMQSQRPPKNNQMWITQGQNYPTFFHTKQFGNFQIPLPPCRVTTLLPYSKMVLEDGDIILSIDCSPELLATHKKIVQELAQREEQERKETEERKLIEEHKKKILEQKRKEELKKIAQRELEDEGLLFNDDAHKRPPIPEDVRNAVWNRDHGQCVQCGSRENLQFDHIIPFSKGGATTIENLQILCQKCNLKKSNHIG